MGLMNKVGLVVLAIVAIILAGLILVIGLESRLTFGLAVGVAVCIWFATTAIVAIKRSIWPAVGQNP